jgi:hypothetical protein
MSLIEEFGVLAPFIFELVPLSNICPVDAQMMILLEDYLTLIIIQLFSLL